MRYQSCQRDPSKDSYGKLSIMNRIGDTGRFLKMNEDLLELLRLFRGPF